MIEDEDYGLAKVEHGAWFLVLGTIQAILSRLLDAVQFYDWVRGR